ncbi:hypothetical protein [Clostridium sp.]|uniref:hypothetical protein n=1 Tax=Clostridium sp. TaxID=1506 RepID=UPI0026104B6F|nr:hypothetical protein [Clostridium sp.]
MSKLLEEIKDYLNIHGTAKSKEVSIKERCEKFEVKEKTAELYYYKWKKEFTGSNNCVPKEEKKFESLQKQEESKEKVIIPHDVKPINADEQEVFKKSKLKIISGKVSGVHGEYEVVDGGVKVGEKIIKNEDDLENFRKEEIRQFYLILGEVTEVLNMVK